MTNFKSLFENDIKDEPYPQKRNYKGESIFLVDKFPVANREVLHCSIEKTNSKYVQGFEIEVDGKLKFLGETLKKRKLCGLGFWEDAKGYDPQNFEVQIFTKTGYIFVSNTWEIDIHRKWVMTVMPPGQGVKEGWVEYDPPQKEACSVGSGEWLKGNCNGAAMYSEDIPNGKRGCCDGGDEGDDFDDIVFSVRRVSAK